ncbi:hypothetical protein KFL_000550190 [Klebsormidium nitens]|uniref:RRM domain-containing protein n=1 Tax=Klebsormidium nitens TaxID=105231 RepID=A0A1Y1HXA3_KLENI|nr:hypothetical protein KFL_000550190 [Klebsormidium nitens]|eukprot:GAQ80488.1 hypothetical protein KFL_000550190 [Klebsormidium nitens]
MDEPDEVDYGDSDDDFADLEVDLDDGRDALPQQEAACEPIDTEAGLLCSDKEEGEATPKANPLVADTGASSELEDGEFIMDSEPMQLEETASVHEAASKRQPDFEDGYSEDEEGRRRGEQHRHRRSPGVEPGRAVSHRNKHLDRAHDTLQRSRERERDRRDEARGSVVPPVRGSERHPIPNQGFRNGYSDVHSLVRVGSYPPSHLAPPRQMLDSELARRQPHPHASGPGVPLRPTFGPPLEIRAGSSLAVQSVRSGQGNSQVHIVYQLSAERQPHLHPAPHVLPQPPLRPPILSHATFDLRPPFGGPPLLPAGLHPLPVMAAGTGANAHRVPLVANGPFRQGGRPSNAPPGRDPPPPHSRNEHLHRGHSNSPGGEFARGSRAPKDVPRGGSGRMESVRAQLEDQGNLRGDPPRVRLNGHRSAVAPPPPPPPPRRADERPLTSRSPPAPARRADERALTTRSPPAPARRTDERPLTSRSPPPPARRTDERALTSRSPPAPARRADERALTSRSPPAPARRADERMVTSRSPPADANGRGEAKQRPNVSPERTKEVKRQKSEGAADDISKERVTGWSEDRSFRGNKGRSPGKSESEGRESGGSSKRETSADRVQDFQRSPAVGKNVDIEKQPRTSDGDRKLTEKKEEGLSNDRRGSEDRRTSSVRAEANGEADKKVSGRDSSEPHRSASRSSHELRRSEEGDRSTKRKREDDARGSEEREKEAREKEMRHRALQILEAGRHKKRKEREEQRRNDPGGHEPGTSGREGHRSGLQGVRKDGRDKKAQRNYRRPSEFDDNDERSRSRSQGRGDSSEEPRRRSADLWDKRPLPEPNGVGRTGRGGHPVRLDEKGDSFERSRGGLWADRGNKLGDGHTQPNSRRVVVGLGAIERRPDLPRFSDRDRDFSSSRNAARESPGPPGFENRAPAPRPRFGGNPETWVGRLGDPDRADGLQRSGSGPVVSIGARQPSKTLAVNNLPENIKSGRILDIFNKYGPVQLVRQTGKSSVEVTFRREEEAKAARANVHRMIKLEGKEVLVEYKAPVSA